MLLRVRHAAGGGLTLRAHGSGQACYHARAPEKCEECRAFLRARQQRDGQREGTYRYQQVYGIGRAGELARANSRRNWRVRANRRDEMRLAELTKG